MTKLDSGPIDPEQFRNVLGRFASGVTIVTTKVADNIHGMTASSFVSVSLNPPLILVSIDKAARFHNLLKESGRFGVSILSENQQPLSNHFADRKTSGIEVPYIEKDNIALIDGAIAHLIVDVNQIYSAGDHSLFLGKVRYLKSFNGRPLVFYSGNYQKIHPIQ